MSKLDSTEYLGYKAYFCHKKGEEDIKYADNNVSVFKEARPCKLCKRFPIITKNHRYDACLGKLPGVKNACCGHGLKDGYIQFNNLVRVNTKKLTKQALELEEKLKSIQHFNQ